LDTYHVVLYVHLLSLFLALGAASVMMACLFQLRAAQTLIDAVPWGTLAGKIAHIFPVAVLGLFATGAYMTTDVWTWRTGWIVVSIVGLAIVAVQGPLLGERNGKKLKQALMANGPGPLGADARRRARHPGMWVADLANIGVVLGVVWNMTQKPGTGSAVAAVAIGYAVGFIAAWRLSRLPADVPAAATEPAA